MHDEDLKGKKLLILGGAFLHVELVKAASRLGVETYVTDYLPVEKAEAKQIADHAWNLNITDIDAITARCREEHMDGVVNMYFNPCQVPNQAICERLGLPSFGTREQYAVFTDKNRFLDTCQQYGVDIIPQYREEDFAFDNPAVHYPVYVKPSDSRASRGQSICRRYEEVAPAIARARSESGNGKVVIERFMEGQDIQLTYVMIDGKLHLEFAADKHDGKAEEDLAAIVICGIAPSRYTHTVIADATPAIERMLNGIGLRNAVVFLQGFVDGHKLRLYDPALRFPATQYEGFVRAVTGIDPYEAMVRFALTGRFPEAMRRVEAVQTWPGAVGVLLFVYIRPGTVHRVTGLAEVCRRSELIGIECRFREGDILEGWRRDYSQCIYSIMLRCTDLHHAEKTIREIYDTLHVLDEQGREMIIAKFDTAKLWE